MSKVSVTEVLPTEPGDRARDVRAGAPVNPEPAAPGSAFRLKNSATYETLLIAVLILATCVCYANMLSNGFVYDDDQQILQNPYVKSWKFVPVRPGPRTITAH